MRDGLVVVLLLGVGVYFAYPYVHTQIVARSVAADLRPYVEGKGVPTRRRAMGYSVRLPAAPVRADSGSSWPRAIPIADGHPRVNGHRQ